MVNRLLLPHTYKKWGWFVLIPASIAGLYFQVVNGDAFQVPCQTFAILHQEFLSPIESFVIIETNILPTIIGALCIVGALIVAFSKEKVEDEFIASLRTSSLLWAVLVNFILLFLAFLTIYGTIFLSVMMYNMFTVLFLFIARFNYLLYRHSKFVSHEK